MTKFYHFFSSRRLLGLVGALLCLSASTHGQTTVFFEKMGTVAATSTFASQTINAAWNNNNLVFGAGAAPATVGDLRNTSGRGTDGTTDANVFLSNTSLPRTFEIGNINTATYTNLLVSFFYRKESATALPSMVLEYSTNGTTYTPVSFSYTQVATTATGWYAINNVSLPAAAQTTNLRLRWRQTSATVSVRIDEVRLTGTAPAVVTATLAVSATNLYNFGEVYVDSTSTMQYYTVSGTNLTGNVTITAPASFVISSSCTGVYGSTLTLTPSNGTLSTTTIYVKLKPSSTGSKSGNITHASTGAVTQNKAVAGTGRGTYIPTNYYAPTAGLTGFTLKTRLKSIIDGHIKRSYANLLNDYRQTDPKYNGKVWDMYSTKPCTEPAYEYTFDDVVGGVGAEGLGTNREHVFPSSWFGGESPFTGSTSSDTLGTDLHMVIPTDAWINQERSNYPYATVNSSPIRTFTNGGKYGNSATAGYSGLAYEPINEFKGDIARILLYVAVRYEASIAAWQANSIADNVLNGTSTSVYDSWFLNQLIAWHKADPVSHKEILRNHKAYIIQGNRNPFVDNPTMVSAIWENADATAPAATLFAPADNATNVGVSSNLVLTFSENVVKGTGNIVIRRTSDNAVIENIAATSSAVTISTNTATINPTTDWSSSTAYYVTIDATAFKDAANNFYAGISSTTAWNFTTADIVAPTATAFSPADNAIGVSSAANLVLTFSENVVKGTGNIVLKKTIDNSVVETIDVAAVSVSGNTATINPVADLAISTEYYVTIDATAFKDASNNLFAGISSTTAWSFVTSGPCMTETFANLGSSTTYGTRNWTGINGGAWSATDAREDQTITGKAITVRTGRLFCPSVVGGCGVITVSHRVPFIETAPSFTVWVNGVQYGGAIVPTATAQVANIAVNVAGTVAIEFRTSGARVTFDNLSWTCYEAPTGIQNVTYVAEVAKSATLRKSIECNVYPNPSIGLVHLQMNEHATYTVLNALGQEVLEGKINNETSTVDFSNYANGIYLLKIVYGGQIITKQLTINR